MNEILNGIPTEEIKTSLYQLETIYNILPRSNIGLDLSVTLTNILILILADVDIVKGLIFITLLRIITSDKLIRLFLPILVLTFTTVNKD